VALLPGKKYIGQIAHYSERDRVGVIATSTRELFAFSQFTSGFDLGSIDRSVEFVIFIPDLEARVESTPQIRYVKEIVRVLR